MKLTNQQTLNTSIENVWEALNAPEILQACIPGCESFTTAADDTHEVVVLAAIGPVKARFKGKLVLSDIEAPTSYRLNFEGQGGAAGYGKGSAIVTLQENNPEETLLHYSANATVGGKIAQIGQRLVDMAAQRMAADFFKKFNIALEERYPAPDAGTGEGAPAPEKTTDDTVEKPQSWYDKSKSWSKNLSNTIRRNKENT